MLKITEKLKNNLCLEPPARPFSGESRYLTTLWVSENGEPPDEQQQQVSPSVDSSLSTISKKLRNNLCLEPPARPFSGESRYLTSLWVSENGEPRDEEQQVSPSVGSSLSTISRLEPTAENIVLHNQKIGGTIKSALKRLSFREQRVLVQFWSPHVIGKHLLLLTTMDQPFGLGVNDDEGLVSYRKYSEYHPFLVDKDLQEEDHSPPARVFRRGLPEWTSDIPSNYNPKDFPLQDCAIRCNLHGYLALPVFDSTTGLCVGVLELLMSSKYTSFDYEVGQVHRVLKKVNLAGPKTFGYPASMVSDARQSDMYKIQDALKNVCRTYSLPLAQTWAASPYTSFVSHEQVIGKSCNSFHTRCVGKFCLSTADLPFHVQDLDMWSFREACRERHLESPRGVVGRVFSTHGSCYCIDVTKLTEEEYPLVHNARRSKLTGCFAILLQSDNSNDKYVLEFFLPGEIKASRYVSGMVQTLKEKMVAFGFELGDKSSIQVVGPPTDLYVHKEPDIIQTSTMGDNFSFCMDSSCSEASVTSITGTDSANAVSPTHMSMETTCADYILKEDRKRKRDSDIVPTVTRKVTVKATCNGIKSEFQFCIPCGLSKLKNEVAKRFKLKGNMIKLKYLDEENDWILISIDEDMEPALCASGSDDTINLICEKIKV